MGISAIPYSEYVAFFQLIGVAPDPYEIEILEVFDSIALKYYAKQQELNRNLRRNNKIEIEALQGFGCT